MSRKIILVTGSNTGIGLELVRLLAAQGHTVYLSSRNESAGKDAQATLAAEGLAVHYVQLDVTDPKSVAAAYKTIELDQGHLDVLVNNAGIAMMDHPQNAATVDVAVLRSVFEANFFGLVQTTTAFLPLMRRVPHPVVLNVTIDMASNALQARPGSGLHFAAYNTSKAAVNSYTIALAHELRDEVIVNCVTPGFTTTKLNGFREGGRSAKEGAEALLPWAILGGDGPTGLFIGGDGKELPW
jgi:NAD(P)-dependent dehydrogenase (short-subunit alcohol dehydrogenase family)